MTPLVDFSALAIASQVVTYGVRECGIEAMHDILYLANPDMITMLHQSFTTWDMSRARSSQSSPASISTASIHCSRLIDGYFGASRQRCRSGLMATVPWWVVSLPAGYTSGRSFFLAITMISSDITFPHFDPQVKYGRIESVLD